VAEPQPDEPHIAIGDRADDVVVEMSHAPSVPQDRGVPAAAPPSTTQRPGPRGRRGAGALSLWACCSEEVVAVDVPLAVVGLDEGETAVLAEHGDAGGPVAVVHALDHRAVDHVEDRGVDALRLGPLLEALGAGAALRIAERRIGGRVHHERAGGVAVGLCRGLEELVEPVADRGEIVLGQRSRLGVLALLGGGVAVRVARVLGLLLGGALGLLSGLRPLLGGALALLGGSAVGLGGVILGVGTVLGGALLDGRAVVLLLVPAGEAAASRGTGH